MYSPGMSKRAVSIRIDEGLWEWLGVYAEQRGSNRTAVLEASVRSLRGDAAGGVPDLEQASSEAEGAVATERAGPAPVVSSEAARPAAPARAPVKKAVIAPPPFADPMNARERQEKLNKAKYGR
jgi:hypothetical protein